VDDNVQLLNVIGVALEDKGYHVTKVSSGQGAIDLLLKRRFDLVITDLNMDRVNGFDILKHNKKIRPGSPVMIITGNSDANVYENAMRLGVDDFMWKPFSLKEFWSRVENLIKKSLQKRRRSGFSVMNVQNSEISCIADVVSGF
jgi:two-component system response regulator PilR (NtrC family)